VIAGSSADPEVCYDAIYMQPHDEHDRAAATALRQLKQALTASSAGHELQTGDLLIVDNRRVVHARTPFKPRFDGTDRWLMRTMICSSLPVHRRRGSVRAIPTGA
jgi:L-asparagine oxygenase